MPNAEMILTGIVQVGIVGFFGSLFIEMISGNIKSKAERMKQKNRP